MINRYLNHPKYKYKIYKVVFKNELKCLFVFRICKYKKFKAIRIVDYIGHKKNFKFGKNLFVSLLNQNSAEFIDLYSYGISNRYIHLSGLKNVKKYSKKKIIIPNYFEPFERKNIKLPLAQKFRSKDFFPTVFFKGDSDLDRPNIL